MRFLIIIIVLLGSTSVCQAREDEHLIPEDSIFSEKYYQDVEYIFDDYYKNVLNAFDEAFKHDTFGRVIVFPSFQNEYAISLTRNENAYEVLYLEAEQQIWGFETLKSLKNGEVTIVGDDGSQIQNEIDELENRLPSTPEGIKIIECKLKIPQKTGDRLYLLWAEMLFRTRYPDRRPVTIGGDDEIIVRADGTTYHFSFDYELPRLTGKIWSPQKDSVTGKFVEVTHLLKKSCLEKENKHLDKANKLSRSILKRLRKRPY